MTEHSPQRFAYFGPEGTFTEAALRTLPESDDAVREPYPTVSAALEAVRRGDADAAMVPLENSVEGPVTTTVDDLADGGALIITAEVLLPVEFALLVRPQTRFADIKRICTHPHAFAQCRRWLAGTSRTPRCRPAPPPRAPRRPSPTRRRSTTRRSPRRSPASATA